MVNYKDWIKLDRDEQGFIFVPRFVKQVSDMEYGSIVTHENYNEKLNLNSTQGDYNTEVLRILFTERDAKKTFRIPYLDDKVDAEVLDAAKNLKIVVRAGAGYDNVDLEAATAHNVCVMNTPGQNSNAVAELALGMMVMMARNQ